MENVLSLENAIKSLVRSQVVLSDSVEQTDRDHTLNRIRDVPTGWGLPEALDQYQNYLVKRPYPWMLTCIGFLAD